MGEAARAFDGHGRSKLFQSIPKAIPQKEEPEVPWQKVHAGAMPPMMFELRFSDGQIISYPFNDLRQVRFRDAGHIELSILGMERLLVTIRGRHLRELAGLLSCGMVRWIEEIDERDLDRPEESPTVVSISVQIVESN